MYHQKIQMPRFAHWSNSGPLSYSQDVHWMSLIARRDGTHVALERVAEKGAAKNLREFVKVESVAQAIGSQEERLAKERK